MEFELGKGHEPLACYAENPSNTRKRDHDIDESERRTCFQRDRDRILHSTAFRRLKDKTQLFIYPGNDHIRNRLTHSLEVAQIARSIARCLKLNEDLTEAVALAHDLGHAPFGHAGERVLEELLIDKEGYDHNAQSFRIVTFLEQSYFNYDGLNLSWETKEGIIKHNGPLTDVEGNPLSGNSKLPFGITSYPRYKELQLHLNGSAEAQVAAIADDIAYTAHDIDDGLRSKLIKIDDIRDLPLLHEIIEQVDLEKAKVEGKKISDHTNNNEIVRRIIKRFVNDVIDTSNKKLSSLNPGNPDKIRNKTENVISLSIEGKDWLEKIKEFQHKYIQKHEKVISAEEHGKTIIEALLRNTSRNLKKWMIGIRDFLKKQKLTLIGSLLNILVDFRIDLRSVNMTDYVVLQN